MKVGSCMSTNEISYVRDLIENVENAIVICLEDQIQKWILIPNKILKIY